MCVWGIRNGTLSYRAGIPKGWRREGGDREGARTLHTAVSENRVGAPAVRQGKRERARSSSVQEAEVGGITALWPVWDTYETLKKVGTLGR